MKEAENVRKSIFVYVFIYFIFVYVSSIYDNDMRYTKIYDSFIHDYSPNIVVTVQSKSYLFLQRIKFTYIIQHTSKFKQIRFILFNIMNIQIYK